MMVCISKNIASCNLEMKCEKVGVRVFFNKNHFYAGDVYKCPRCGKTAINCNSAPGHDYAGFDEKDPFHFKAAGYKE